MKTTVKIYLRKHKSGKGVLVWRITRHRISRELTSSFEVFPLEWDETGQKIVSKNSSAKRKKALSLIKSELELKKMVMLRVIEVFGAKDYTARDVIDRFLWLQQRPILR